MSSDRSNTRQYYDQLAQTADEQDAFWQNPYDEEVWRTEHALLGDYLTRDAPLVDVGCGYYPHDAFSADIPIIGLDLSFMSLLVARRNPPSERMIALVQADALILPFESHSLTQIIAGGELLNHVDAARALAEFARVLKPGGVVLIAFGSKWCLDSLWAILDGFTGGHLGYALTRAEAASMFRVGTDPRVSWDITPIGGLEVTLLRVGALLKTARGLGFDIERTASTNLASGIVPLPIQQDSQNHLLRSVSSVLLRIDRILGKIPFVNRFAGNYFAVLRRI